MKQFRVAEIFGPTIQGEGRRIGTPCHFIRFAGCDYRCSWCDSPHAVLPEFVAYMKKMSVEDILEELSALSWREWIVFSGGNPALFDLGELVDELHDRGHYLMVETQGTEWKGWLQDIDDVCISPKPPSSGNTTSGGTLRTFLAQFIRYQSKPYLKFVVFDDHDYEYARFMSKEFGHLETFLSVGNEDPYLPTVANPTPAFDSLAYVESETTQQVVLKKMKWLMEKVAGDPHMDHVRVLPQMHVLAWGNQRGR